jgi:hypothetical protein
MKKIYSQAKPLRSFRRYVRKMFSSFIRHQKSNRQAEQEKIIEILQDIQDAIEIMVREMARQVNRDK